MRKTNNKIRSLVSQAELCLPLAWNNIYKISLWVSSHWLEEKLVVIMPASTDLYEIPDVSLHLKTSRQFSSCIPSINSRKDQKPISLWSSPEPQLMQQNGKPGCLKKPALPNPSQQISGPKGFSILLLQMRIHSNFYSYLFEFIHAKESEQMKKPLNPARSPDWHSLLQYLACISHPEANQLVLFLLFKIFH